MGGWVGGGGWLVSMIYLGKPQRPAPPGGWSGTQTDGYHRMSTYKFTHRQQLDAIFRFVSCNIKEWCAMYARVFSVWNNWDLCVSANVLNCLVYVAAKVNWWLKYILL
mgnify:CR=1 FL=1